MTEETIKITGRWFEVVDDDDPVTAWPRLLGEVAEAGWVPIGAPVISRGGDAIRLRQRAIPADSLVWRTVSRLLAR